MGNTCSDDTLKIDGSPTFQMGWGWIHR